MVVQNFKVLQDLRMIANLIETTVLDLMVFDGTKHTDFLDAG
mgnify:CR=1 FL=1